LDVAWLQFLKSHQASTEPLHDLLALLVSHQMGRGHACLDLEVLWQDAKQLLNWSDAQANALKQYAAPSNQAPVDLFSEAANPWVEAAKTLPWAMGEHSPIVLSMQADGQAQGFKPPFNCAWQRHLTCHKTPIKSWMHCLAL
jgi:exodeoxyribonuclease V alpha subunit